MLRPTNPRRVVGGGLLGALQPGGDGPGGPRHQLAVEDEELLERHGGLDPPAAGDVWVGEVEQAEHPRQVVAADGRVSGPPLVLGRVQRLALLIRFNQ